MNNILTQNDGNNQLGIGSSQINLVGVANDSFDIAQDTTSFMSFSTVDGSRKISVKKPITLNNNLLTIKSTAKIDSAATNSLFYIDDNSELKTLGIGTTDEYLRMGFNRPAWGPKTFTETNISGIGSIGYLEELKIDDDKLIGIGSVLGVTDSSTSNIIKYDTNNDTSLIMSNGVGIGTLTIQTKYDTNFFDITLKKIDSDFSSNPTSKSLEIVDAKTYKYTITDLGNNSIHYYKLSINDINSFTTSTKKIHHITLRRDSTGPVVASFIIEGSPVGIGSQAPVHLQFDTPVQNFVPNDDITTQNGTIALSNPSADKMTWIGYFTPTSNTEDSTNILTLSDTYEDLAGNKGVTATTENYIVDTIAPTNQNTVFNSSITVTSQATVSISSANETGGSVWFAPNGTTTFSASSTMTTASGTATSITAPTTEGTYYLYIIDASGNVSNKSSNTLTVDTTAPTNQNTVFSSSITVGGGVSVSISSANESGGSVWFAPTGTTSFSASSTMTTASGTATSITAPTTEGTYYLYIIDSVGNISNKSSNTLTVDTTAPTNQNTVFSSSITVGGGVSVSISSANESGGSVWFAPTGTTSFSASSTMTTASGTATSITAPATGGTYYLYVIDAVGNVSNKSSNTLTVDTTAPTNQNTVFNSSIAVTPQATVSISSANETGGSVWFAPTGTTSFSASSTMTTASGTATSITAPTTEGTYYLYIIDSVGNISNKSSNTLTVDNTAPSFSQGSYSFSISNNTSSSSVGSVSATDTYSITYSIVSYSSNIFAINSSNGAITLSTNCSDGNYSLTVRASDPAGNTTDVNISVKVDTTGPSFSTTSFSISTGTTSVGTVTATDPSPTSNPITYTNVGGTHTSYFSITSGGVLSLNSSGYSDGTYTVTIRATDALNNYSDQSISVTLATPFGTNWEKITDIGFSSSPNPIGTTHNSSSTKTYLTQSMNWASWSNSSIKEYVMVEFEFYHTGTTGYQVLLTLGADALAISPQWYVIFSASTNWFYTPANKIVITNNSITAGQQSWVDYTHTSSNAGIAQGSYQGQKPGVGIRSQTNFSTYTTYKVKIVWEARLPAAYTYSNSYDAYKARTSPGLDTTQIYLYVDSGSGYVLDTYTPNYAQSWAYGMGANYPPARGYGGETSKRDNVGLGPNAMQSYFNIGYYYWSSTYAPLRSGTTVKPLQLCKIKKKSGGQYTVNSSTF